MKVSQFVGVLQEAALKVVEWAENTIRRFLGVGAAAPSCDPSTPAGRQPDGAYLATFGALLDKRPISPPLWHCIERKQADTAEWRYVLNRGVSLFAHADNSAGRARVTGVHVTGDLLVDLFAVGSANLLKNTSLPLLWPATSQLTAALDSSAGSGNLFVGGTASMAAATVIVQALKEISALFPPPLGDLYGIASSCLWAGGNQVANNIAALNGASPAQIYDALMSTINTAFACVAGKATGAAQETLLQNDMLDPLKRISKLGRSLLFVKALSYGFIIADGVSLGMVGDDQNDVRMQFNGPVPNQPGLHDGGLANGAASLPANVILKVAGPARTTYWLDEDRVAHHIPDGMTYICLAETMPTWFGVDDAELSEAVDSYGDEAACPPSSAPPRDLGPDTWRNVLMRHDGDSAWWYVRPDGNVVALLDHPDGPTCRFDDLLVWDFVADEDISAFPNDASQPDRPMC